MKNLIILIALFSSINGQATSSIPKHDLKNVLQTIDNVCADTWCEGDYNFNFKSLKCSEAKDSGSTCVLKFQFIDENNGRAKKSKIQTCTFKNIRKIDQLISEGNLPDLFMDDVSICISNLETKVKF